MRAQTGINMQQTMQRRRKSTVSTVEEKVHLENKLPFNPGQKKGPTVDLFFHELTCQKGVGQQVLRTVGTVILSILFLASFPIIALFIKLFSQESVIQKTAVPGRRGIVFQYYTYPTKRTISNKSFAFGTFLQKTGLYKLPSVINIWKGQLNLVGPGVYAAEKCNYWNKKLSDYYKRFAMPPGYFGVSKPVKDPDNLQEVSRSLEDELNYILSPTLTKDLKYLIKGA